MKTGSRKGIFARACLHLVAATGLLISLVCMPQRAVQAAAVRYVKPDGALMGTCNSWLNACTLHAALSVAVAGDALWVKAGTYTPTSGTDRSSTIQLRNGVGIFGGYAGTETKPGQRDPVANVTTLSGNIGSLGHSTDNSYHVVTGSGTNSTAVLDGFTITGGYADNDPFNQSVGAGMYNEGGSPTLTNLIFSGNSADAGGGMYNFLNSSPHLNQVSFNSNSATENGGGMCNNGSSPALGSVTFTGNTAGAYGGGMYNYNSSPAVNNVTFSNNTTEYGGGMYNNGSSPTLGNVTFSSNSVIYHGGGMYAANHSNPVLINVTFTGNSAAHGGGLYSTNSSPVLSNVTFGNNTASSGGGIYNDGNSNPTLTNVTFTGNTAVNNGGGIKNSSSSPTFNNASFLDNSSTFGGGMDNYGSSPTLNNVTFSGNSASYTGGGMYNWQNSSPVLVNVTFSGNSAGGIGGGGISNNSANPAIRDSILWGNTAPTNPQMLDVSSTPVVSYSDIQGGYAGEGNLNADPLLGSLGTYGGSTQVFPLLPGSAAIDSGRNVTCASTDQRGISRPQGSHCDMGAFESRGFALSITAGDYQSAQINSAFTQSLALSVSSSHAEPVNGGRISYSAPAGGASAVLSTSSALVAAGAASVTAEANGIHGAFNVTAHAAGASPSAVFHLTNTFPPGSPRIYLPLIRR